MTRVHPAFRRIKWYSWVPPADPHVGWSRAGTRAWARRRLHRGGPPYIKSGNWRERALGGCKTDGKLWFQSILWARRALFNGTIFKSIGQTVVEILHYPTVFYLIALI